MKKQLIHGLGALLLVTAASLPVYAQDEAPVYGRELMTEQELQEHRERMRSFESQEEREKYRAEHHKRMQERARERGVTIPEEPGPRGKGMGYGQNQGQGKSQGQGSGQGSGK